MESKWKLFVMLDCDNCNMVKKWLNNHDPIPDLEVITVDNDDLSVLAEADFYDVFAYPALRPANGPGGWDSVTSILDALRDIAAGRETKQRHEDG